jgi:hypothetical protein
MVERYVELYEGILTNNLETGPSLDLAIEVAA